MKQFWDVKIFQSKIYLILTQNLLNKKSLKSCKFLPHEKFQLIKMRQSGWVECTPNLQLKPFQKREEVVLKELKFNCFLGDKTLKDLKS